jgi:uncharacterized protein YecT (DUF1311 family)
MRVLLLISVGLAWTVSIACAEDAARDPIDVKMTACYETDPSTAGMLACANAAEDAWDRELNTAYKALQAAVKGKTRDALLLAQRAWIEQRNKEFGLYSALGGEVTGTMWAPILADQRMMLVRARTQQLRAYLDMLKDGRS